MALSERENYLRNAKLCGPEWIPATIHVSDASWDQLRYELEDVLARHPALFPDFQPGQRDYQHYDFGPGRRAGEDYTDAWGCVWRGAINGITGVVVHSPLADWASLEGYQPPDPLDDDLASEHSALWGRRPANWEEERRRVEQARRNGQVARGSVGHGFMFLLLCDLRGFQNFMLDMATDAPQLSRLIDIVATYNRTLLEQWLSMGLDVMEFGDDLGAQTASVPGPRHFSRYVAPQYKILFDMCHKKGTLVAFHSDGYIMDIMDQLLATGIDIINPQDLVNGVDNLAREVKGRACIRLDIDRQKIIPYGTRKEIRELIEYEVRTLGAPEGGLELICGIYPPTPAENVDAVCCAVEEFRTYWWDGGAG